MAGQGRTTDLEADLRSWFAERGRDLPWRRTRDPWVVLVSELMLQQTQVARVVERLDPFLAQFPSPEAMACGPAADVISAWSGLGYNRRALNLHRAACQLVEQHAGTIPDSLPELLSLPGVGPYTARAILVFAFEQAEAVVDTNIGRVLARWEGRSLRARQVQELADRLVPSDDPWVWNQGLMELGALVCTKNPLCAECPVSSGCLWFRAGRPDPDPARGSAAVSRGQTRFDGSDRQGRAALVRALMIGGVREDALASAMGWPDDPDRALRVVESLISDGLVVRTVDGIFKLPT